MTRKPKKSEKLVLRKQVVRQLGQLDLKTVDGGGHAAMAFDTKDVTCTSQAGTQTLVSCIGC